MVDISVIIPVYNPNTLIKRCLDSIICQKGNCSYEVLLVDDGSTDDSNAIIESYENPCFVTLRQENAGPAKARNKGLKIARGKYICFIDADDYWEDTFFEKTVSFLEKHNECIAVSVGQKHLTVSGEFIAPACLDEYKNPIVLDDFFSFWANWMHVCTGSVMIRADYVKRTGGQREDLRITEDLEFWALLATYGKFGMIPEVLFTSDGTDTISNSKGWLNKMKIRWANAPTIENWQTRIIESLPSLLDNDGFKLAQGRIGRNLTYSLLLSGRISMAREQALSYGAFFRKDGIGRLMNFCKNNYLLWWLMCKFLTYREYHRY